MERSIRSEPDRKRRRIDLNIGVSIGDDSSSLATFLEPISPPPGRMQVEPDPNAIESSFSNANLTERSKPIEASTTAMASPVQLTRVNELPTSNNIDTVTLKDIIGDPLIKECWAFNYLIDVDFFMNTFDKDVRDEIEVTFVHGSWKREDGNRLRIEEAVSRYKRAKVKAVCAYMPDPFGTHHSKMIVLTRHDDTAQVIILTANFIPQDFRMCQAVWRSPLLPMSQETVKGTGRPPVSEVGDRFKFDFISYLKSYGSKLKDLIPKLERYDFSTVRAALVASTPSKQNHRTLNLGQETPWGWPAVKQVLASIPVTTEQSRIVVQISSVATLGVEDKWLRQSLFRSLSSHLPPDLLHSTPPPRFSIIFPTAESMRRSIDGYDCGGSIHMKTESAQNVKQLKYLRPMLCHWAGDTTDKPLQHTSAGSPHDAGRKRTGPHIKTYLRFADEEMTKLDWAMVTSANLSKQAWGAEIMSSGEVKICSYEIGVVVWPGLWEEEGKKAEMVPVFKKDMPEAKDEDTKMDGPGHSVQSESKVRIGFRMPYDLPLVPYGNQDMPWCAQKAYSEPDWKGQIWPGWSR